jgi:hypothetical protein
MNPVHTLVPTRFDIILPTKPQYVKWSAPVFPTKILYAFLYRSIYINANKHSLLSFIIQQLKIIYNISVWFEGILSEGFAQNITIY